MHRLQLAGLLIVVVCVVAGAQAQDATFNLPQLEPVTLANAERLTELAVIGAGRVDQLALSPDGQSLVVVTRPGIFIHDLTQPDTAPRLIAAEYAPIINTVFHPDWSWVAISTPDTLRLLDIETGSLIREISRGNGGVHATANDMLLSSDGRWLAISQGLDGGQMLVWDTASGNLLYDWYHRYTVGSPVFSPADESFAYVYREIANIGINTELYNVWYLVDTGSWDFFEASEHKTHFGTFATDFRSFDLNESPFSTHNSRLTSSPNRRLLVAEGSDDRFRVWNVVTGEQVALLPESYQFELFSPDGRLLIFDTAQSLWLLFDLPTGNVEPVMRDEGRALFAFSADGRTLAVVDRTGSVRIINRETMARNPILTGQYWGAINEMVFRTDGATLYFSAGEVTLRRLDLLTGEVDLITHLPDATGDIALSESLSVIALGTVHGGIEIRDLETGELLKALTEHEGQITDIAFSRDGAMLASASEDHTVRIWDVPTGESRVLDRYEAQSIDALALSPDGTRLLAVDRNSGLGIILYSLEDNTPIVTIPLFTSPRRGDVTFSPDGDRVAIEGEIWQVTDLLTSSEEFNNVYGDDSLDTVFSSLGDLLFTSSSDAYIRIFNTVAGLNALTGETVVSLEGHPDAIATMAFSPDGRILALGGLDGRIALWGVPASGG